MMRTALIAFTLVGVILTMLGLGALALVVAPTAPPGLVLALGLAQFLLFVTAMFTAEALAR